MKPIVLFLISTSIPKSINSLTNSLVSSGTITLNPLTVSQVLNVDGATSLDIRITALPDSVDIIPVRNQLVEIDLVNTTVTVGLDRLEVGDINTINIVDRATSSYTNTASGF